jgi:NTP pyrophosphatase (non-canonical NTP hydrolase)
MNIPSMIHSYFRHRKLKTPDALAAILFAQSEMGEVFDAVMRSGMLGEGWVRNHERETDIGEELADTLMMLHLAADALCVDLHQTLEEKFRSKGWVPQYDGTRCPVCASETLEPERGVIAETDARLILPVKCGACEAAWDEIYDLSGFAGLSASGLWERSDHARQSNRH